MKSQWDRFDKMIRPEGRIFYGWRIVLASAGIQLLAGVLWMQSFGAYTVLLQREFGWSKAVVSGAFALTRVESGLLGPLQGWLVDHFGPRAILRIGLILFGVGFMLFSQVNSILSFYLTFALIAVGSSLGGFATIMVSIVNWFSRHRAKAVSISQLGFSMGGLSVPIVILSLELFGWRATAFGSGVIVMLVGLPLVQVVRHKPEDRDEVPDGIRSNDEPTNDTDRPRVQADRDFTAREAMRTRAFWLLSLGHASALLTVSAVMVHLVPHLTEGLNFSLAEAGAVVALMTAFQMLGQICGGYLGDRFDKRYICIGCMIGHSSGLLLVAFAGSTMMVMTFALLHGLAWGMRGPLMVALRADYFGPSSFGTIMGFSSLIVMFGMSSGPIIAGYMADVTGNYQGGLALLACLAFSGSFCFLLAKPPQHRTVVKTSDHP
ncbi:MAG: MFS transporter [Pseudomonadales bacterium]|jgi:sugar phosphate permease|nr:MFS transporter [Pseudomonadales bacterium]MDP7357310.1 MFS transporter [Pseudomonadales bacterium]MDP7596647.1 MFS transporter [Pseudomonadales bacterium]HJN49273.1 MFS transporter [Pseudomonadales bacterium]